MANVVLSFCPLLLLLSASMVLLFARNPQFCEATGESPYDKDLVSWQEIEWMNQCMVVLWTEVFLLTLCYLVQSKANVQLPEFAKELLLTAGFLVTWCIGVVLLIPVGRILAVDNYCPQEEWEPYITFVTVSALMLTPEGWILLGLLASVVVVPALIAYFGCNWARCLLSQKKEFSNPYLEYVLRQ